MIIIIIGIIIVLILHTLRVNKCIEKYKSSDPTKPEKCFFDFELITLHSTFVLALENNLVQLKKIKGKLLPSVCILDMIINRKSGWDKFLDNEASRYGTGDRKSTLLAYLKENYDLTVSYANSNGLEFLTKPTQLMVPTDPKTFNQDCTEIKVAKTLDILKDFQDTLVKKIDKEAGI